MEKYMGEKVTVGGHVIDGIEMLDDSTCCLYFEEFEEDGYLVCIVVEYWLDEDSWHFIDNFYDKDGYFIDHEETTYLSEKDKTFCMDFIKSWIEDLDK